MRSRAEAPLEAGSADQRVDQVLELGGGIVGQPGMDRRRLDDRAGRRHQPVEPLGDRQSRDRTAVRVAPGDALDGVEVGPDRDWIGIGRERRSGASSSSVLAPMYAPRSAQQHDAGIEALRRARRAARRGRSRTGTGYAARRARSASSTNADGVGQPAFEIAHVGGRWPSASPAIGSSGSHSRGWRRPARWNRPASSVGARRASAVVDRPGERQQHVVADALERPLGVLVGVAPGVVDVQRGPVVDQPDPAVPDEQVRVGRGAVGVGHERVEPHDRRRRALGIDLG